MRYVPRPPQRTEKVALPTLIFARLKGCAQSSRGGFSLVRAYADLLCKAVVISVIVNTVFNVAHYTLKRLFALLALCFVLLLFHLKNLFSANFGLHSYCANAEKNLCKYRRKQNVNFYHRRFAPFYA